MPPQPRTLPTFVLRAPEQYSNLVSAQPRPFRAPRRATPHLGLTLPFPICLGVFLTVLQKIWESRNNLVFRNTSSLLISVTMVAAVIIVLILDQRNPRFYFSWCDLDMKLIYACYVPSRSFQ